MLAIEMRKMKTGPKKNNSGHFVIKWENQNWDKALGIIFSEKETF